MNVSNLLLLALLAIPVGSAALTLTRSFLFQGYRDWAARRSALLGELASCPYCTSHWLSFATVAIFRPWVVSCSIPYLGLVVQFMVSSLILVSLASLCAWVVYKAVAAMA